MKLLTDKDGEMNGWALLVLFVITLAIVLMTGCSALDNYDRSYSLNVSDGKQSVGLGVTFHPRSTPLPVPRGLAK